MSTCADCSKFSTCITLKRLEKGEPEMFRSMLRETRQEMRCPHFRKADRSQGVDINRRLGE